MLTQNQLADRAGTARARISERISRLKALGWITTEQPFRDSPLLYILGERAPDSRGNLHEGYYFDAQLTLLWEDLTDHAIEQGLSCAQEMPHRDRQTWMRKRLNALLGKEEVQGVSSNGVQGVSSNGVQGVSSNGVQGVSSNGVHKKERREKEEKEQKENGKALSPSAFAGDAPQLRRGTPSDEIVDGGEKAVEPLLLGAKSGKKGANFSEKPEAATGKGFKVPRKSGASPSEILGKARERKRVQELEAVEQAKSKSLRSDIARENMKGKQVARKNIEALRILEHEWRAEFRECMPDAKVTSWNAKLRKKIEALVEEVGLDAMKLTICFVVRNWPQLRSRFKKSSSIPSLHLVCAVPDQFINDAREWAKLRDVLDEYMAWKADNEWGIPPQRLRKRYKEVYPQAKKLGLVE
jgi:hypothetical protein